MDLTAAVQEGSVGTVNVIGTDSAGHPSTYNGAYNATSPGGAIIVGSAGSGTMNIFQGGLATANSIYIASSDQSAVGTLKTTAQSI